MADSPDSLEQVVHRIDELEQRVWVLEHGSEAHSTNPAASIGTVAPADLGLGGWPAQSGTTFRVLGIAMLGMAGAYLLRAAAESGAMPNVAAVTVAAIYAGAWLISASKLHNADTFSRTTYACVSALILAPMLWESTSRFHYLSAGWAAAVLGTFFVASYLLAWAARLSSVVWISTLATVAASLVLSAVTQVLVPFTAVLLSVALLNEVAVASGRWSAVRAVSAVGADLLVCGLLFIYSRPPVARVEYTDVQAGVLLGAAVLLFATYGVSAVSQAVVRRRPLAYPEIAQLAVAAILAFEAVLHFASATGVLAFAFACIVLALAGYAALFLQFDPAAERRNHLVCASFSLALMLVGCSLAFSSGWLPSVLGAMAIAAAVIGGGSSRPGLSFHSVAYLIAGGQASGALGYAGHAIFGAFSPPPHSIVWMILVAAVFCYAAGPDRAAENWRDRALRMVSAALAAGAAIAMCVTAVMWVAGRFINPAPWHIAVARTLSAAVVAIAIARLGTWFARTELVRISYGLLTLLALKLLLEDLQHGHAEFIAASIFVYALTLIAVPTLARKSPRPAAARLKERSTVPLPSALHH